MVYKAICETNIFCFMFDSNLKGVWVAVTGGTGCLGRPLIQKLLSMGCYVRILVEPRTAIPSHFEGVDIIRGDILDPLAIDKLLKNAKCVFHLAAKVHDFIGSADLEFMRINVDGTQLLLQKASKSGVKRLVFYSTVGVYGKDGEFHGDELSMCSPQNPYSMSKYAAEQLVLLPQKWGNLEGVVLRFPLAYGAFDKGNMFRMIDAIRRRRFAVFGTGLNVRSLVSSINATEAAVASAFSPGCGGNIYCVTDTIDYTLNQLVETICSGLKLSWRPPNIPHVVASALGVLGETVYGIMGKPPPFGIATVKKLTTNLTFSCEKIRRETGYAPIQTLADGIASEIAWLRSQSI